MIILVDRFYITNPVKRIYGYCSRKDYLQYDSQHNVNDIISLRDIQVVGRLNTRIKQNGEGVRQLISSVDLREALSAVSNQPLGELSDAEWARLRQDVAQLFKCAGSIPGIGLTLATKILHLKRPRLIPVLDPFLVGFLLWGNPINTSKDRIVRVALKCLDKFRGELIRNQEEFISLNWELKDLPFFLETIRLYEILAHSTSYRDILTTQSRLNIGDECNRIEIEGSANASEGHTIFPSASTTTFENSTFGNPDDIVSRYKEILTLEEFDQVISRNTGYIVITDKANQIRIHRVNCKHLRCDWFETKVVTNKNRNGSYYWGADYYGLIMRFAPLTCSWCKPQNTLS